MLDKEKSKLNKIIELINTSKQDIYLDDNMESLQFSLYGGFQYMKSGEINNLKFKIQSQINGIKQREEWINILLNLLKYSNYMEYLDKIMIAITKIQPIQLEKEYLCKLLIDEYSNKIESKKSIKKSKYQINKLILELKKKGNNLIVDKNNLINLIFSLSKQLDQFTEKNYQYNEINKEKIELLKEEVRILKGENDYLTMKICETKIINKRFSLEAENKNIEKKKCLLSNSFNTTKCE